MFAQWLKNINFRYSKNAEFLEMHPKCRDISKQLYNPLFIRGRGRFLKCRLKCRILKCIKMHLKCRCILKLPAKPLYKRPVRGVKNADRFKVQMHFKAAPESAYLIGLQKNAKMQNFLYI
jgi:hypothetical protein